MSSDPTAQASGAPAGEGGAGQPSEAELRPAYEAELSRMTSADMMLQAAVSLLNIASRRLGGAPPPGADRPPEGEGAPAGSERDLEQASEAIDGAGALLAILDRRFGKELGPLRDALAQLQLAYTREVKLGGAPPASTGGEQGREPSPAGASEGPRDDPAADAQQGRRPGPAESSGRLWVPGR